MMAPPKQDKTKIPAHPCVGILGALGIFVILVVIVAFLPCESAEDSQDDQDTRGHTDAKAPNAHRGPPAFTYRSSGRTECRFRRNIAGRSRSQSGPHRCHGLGQQE